MKQIKWVGWLFIAALAGCKSSSITSSWKAANPIAGNYDKVFVLGLISETDRSLPEKMEGHMAADLRNLGYNAVEASMEFGSGVFRNMKEKEALEKLKSGNVDAVMTIVLLNKQMERQFIPAQKQIPPIGDYYNRFWDYLGNTNSLIDEPGYYVNNTYYFWESNFYEMKSQSLICAIRTQSFNPPGPEDLGHEYAQLIIRHMLKKKVIEHRDQQPVKKAF